MRKVVSLLLALALLWAMVPTQVQAASGGKLIALTFDDGPDAKNTPRLLEGLKERGVKVTFFCLGQSAKGNLDILEDAYADGHEIGCHSWDHPDLTELTTAEVKRQFSRSFEVLDQVCGQGASYLVRPPYGSTNASVRSAIDRPLIHWTVDPEDWKYRNADTVCANVVDATRDGSIILVHDIHSTTVDGILMAIDKLQKQGYEFVTVSELFRRRGVSLENGEVYYSCKANGTDLGPIPTPEITYTTDRVKMEVTITADSDAPIYYTTDGTTPNADSHRYTGPFTVDYATDIQAVSAYKLNGSRSETAKLEFGKNPCPAPDMAVEDGVLTMSCSGADADIYYTLDGSEANLGSTRYTGPVTLSGGCTIRAVAGGGYYKKSPETVLYCSDHWNLYADVDPDDWFFEPIEQVVNAGLMMGMGRHNFAPNSKLTRGQLVTLLYRYDGQTLEEDWTRTHSFPDVKSGEYYDAAVEWAYRNGIVNGYSDGTFKPNGNITRQELCKTIDYFLSCRGYALPEGESCRDLFQDYQKIDAWARPSVEAMAAAGLIQGDAKGCMNPRGTATRAEVATILTRMMDYEASCFRQDTVPEPSEPSEDVEPTPDPTESAPPETTAPVETAPPPQTQPTEGVTAPPAQETTVPTESAEEV